jgi:CheY-like chemotaxis protein
MAADRSLLAGRSVFVLEDETLVLFNLEDMLSDLGCIVVGPAMRLAEAEAMIDRAAAADVAMLDVNIGGETVFPLAHRLRERNVPLVFTTGYGRAGMPEGWEGSAVLAKPYTMDQVAEMLLAVGPGGP